MPELRQNTQIKIKIGPAVDANDGVTPETGLALGAADQAELLKHDGAATVDISGRTFAAITGCDGWYNLTLTTSDTDTLGQMDVVIQDSSLMVPIFRPYMVVTQQYWDSKYGTDKLQVDTVEISGDSGAADNFPADLDAEITLIKGLLGFNCVLDDFFYDSNNKATVGNVYVYNSAANAQTHDKSTGLLLKIIGVATISGGNTAKLTRTEA